MPTRVTFFVTILLTFASLGIAPIANANAGQELVPVRCAGLSRLSENALVDAEQLLRKQLSESNTFAELKQAIETFTAAQILKNKIIMRESLKRFRALAAPLDAETVAALDKLHSVRTQILSDTVVDIQKAAKLALNVDPISSQWDPTARAKIYWQSYVVGRSALSPELAIMATRFLLRDPTLSDEARDAAFRYFTAHVEISVYRGLNDDLLSMRKKSEALGVTPPGNLAQLEMIENKILQTAVEGGVSKPYTSDDHQQMLRDIESESGVTGDIFSRMGFPMENPAFRRRAPLRWIDNQLQSLPGFESEKRDPFVLVQNAMVRVSYFAIFLDQIQRMPFNHTIHYDYHISGGVRDLQWPGYGNDGF